MMMRTGCPLWVKSRHIQCKTACPLYPRKRTLRCTRPCRLWARCGRWGEAGKRDELLAKAGEPPGLCFIFHLGPARRDRDRSVSGSLLLVTLVVVVALVVIILALVVVLIHIVLVDGDAACSAAANACPNSRCITAGPHHANWSDLRIEDQVALGVGRDRM